MRRCPSGVRWAVVDKNVPAGLEIGIDPEKDRQRFHVTEGGIVVIPQEGLRKEDEDARA